MKTIYNASFILLMCLFLSIDISAQKPPTQVVFADADDSAISFPLEVATLIDNKCYGCHSPQGRNDKAKEKLIWLDLQKMDKVDLVGALGEVAEVLEEGSMPPEKMIEKYPQMKLTEAEVATLKAWVESAQNKLMDE